MPRLLRAFYGVETLPDPATVPEGTVAFALGGGFQVQLAGAWVPMPSAPPDAPDAPVAVAGDGQATVTVTGAGSGPAPSSFDVVSSPGGLTATIDELEGSPPSGSIVVSGLTNGTAYTFTATAANVLGSSPASPASNAVTPSVPAPQPKLRFLLDEAASPAANTGTAFPSATLLPVGYDDVSWAQAFPDSATLFPATLKVVDGITSGVGGAAGADPLGGQAAATVLLWTDWPSPTGMSNSSRLFGRGALTESMAEKPQFGIYFPFGSNFIYGAITVDDGTNPPALVTTASLGIPTNNVGGVCLWALRFAAGVLTLRLYRASEEAPVVAVSASAAGVIVANAVDPIVVGTDVPSGGRRSPSNIYYSDLRVYDTALSDAQLDEIWSASITP